MPHQTLPPVQAPKIPNPNPNPVLDLSAIASVGDYEAPAKQLLDPSIWAYLDGAAADGITHERNLQEMERLALWPRAMRNASGGDMSTTLLGQTFPHPIFIAPTAYHQLAHPDGELATVTAATALQSCMVVSTLSSLSMESIAAAAQTPLWFQLYIQRRRDVTLDLVRRAEQSGYQAIVVTVDAPVEGMRNAQQRHGFRIPPHVRAENLAPYPSEPQAVLGISDSFFESSLVRNAPTWDDFAWLANQTKLPFIAKGILHPLDVQSALDAGAQGIIVSNHGGRVLDATPATIEALPYIAEAVGGRVPILMDGGIRRGTDVLKALALGAQAVMVGRPIFHGLAVAGSTGVAHILHLLRTELAMAMVLCGIRSLSQVTPALLSPVKRR
ncbi:alpha-hydroxy acid oxidase [Ottowia thiooxydans]|uniref:alpha-hydroxy acid oxidase n=1 Tax=Ottowia thiooxydans TaxID=219182 RepID=UPI0009FCAF76|nr:alpha-hydroxy acid oxidase [Ottowia thiooxydans]